MTVVAFTGHRPNKIGGYDNYVLHSRIREAIIDKLRDRPISRAICGMALGVDQLAFEACLMCSVPVVAAIPFAGQEARWPEHAQAYYRNLLWRASNVTVVSLGGYSAHKMQVRNEWMVDRAHELWAVWNGTSGGTANCIGYCRRKGKPVHNLWDPRWFE